VIVGGEPIAKGPDFHAHVTELVAELVAVARVHGSSSLT
jgi:hypothetical protein